MSSASLSEDSLARVCGRLAVILLSTNSDSHVFVSWLIILCQGTLGIARQEVKTFYMSPRRTNVFQQVRHVEEVSTRLCSCALSDVFDTIIKYDIGSTTTPWDF